MRYLCLTLVLSLTIVTLAVSAPISCSLNDARANDAIADACYGDSSVGANPASEALFINNNTGADPLFNFVAKYEKEGGPSEDNLSGWNLMVAPVADSNYFEYTLTAPDAFVGTTINFALGVKQASDSFIAYIFNNVELNIDGTFVSAWLNPQGQEVVDYSHASAFVQGAAPVPEPSTLLLLGAGLVGVAAYRRKRK